MSDDDKLVDRLLVAAQTKEWKKMSDGIPESALQAARAYWHDVLNLATPNTHTVEGFILATSRAMHEYAQVQRTFKDRAADALADEVAVLVHRRVIDSRSPAGDALLDYRNPPSTHALERFARMEDEHATIKQQLAAAKEALGRIANEWPRRNSDVPVSAEHVARYALAKLGAKP